MSINFSFFFFFIPMKDYILSYISKSGLVVLNHLVSAKNSFEAVEEVKGSEGISMVLSIVKKNDI